MRFIRSNGIKGKLFNAYQLGGYLDYRLPEMKPMVDGRMTLWQNKQEQSTFLEYAKMMYVEPGSKELFQRYNPDYVLTQRFFPLARMLYTQENWPIIYEDKQVVLFENPNHKFTD